MFPGEGEGRTREGSGLDRPLTVVLRRGSAEHGLVGRLDIVH